MPLQGEGQDWGPAGQSPWLCSSRPSPHPEPLQAHLQQEHGSALDLSPLPGQVWGEGRPLCRPE